jgi:DNA repair protein RadB
VSDPVPIGCEPLDDLLGGGFDRGVVTQLYGPPAAGKTNLALSAAVQVASGGGTVLYIDTEGLSIERFRQIAEVQTDGDVESVASRLIITEAYDFDDQAEAVRDAAEFAPEADLIVLDSATGFYRIERAADVEGGEALRTIADQITHLLSLARRHDLAVVATNQVYTDPESDRTRPLGGNTLEHWTGVILRLDRFRGGNRRATLEKHRSRAAGDQATFRITGSGIEGTDGGPGMDGL